MKDLTKLQVQQLNRPGVHRASRNLYVQVTDAGTRSWLFRYMHNGQARHMGLGPLELVSLADARAQVIELRKLLLGGTDPLTARRGEREQAKIEAARAMTFKACAEAYIRAREPGWRNPKHRAQWRSTLEAYVYPIIGDLPVADVDTGLVLKALEPIWLSRPETAGRVRGRIEAVLDAAKARGWRGGENPARWRGHLDKLLAKKEDVRAVRHQPAMPYADVPGFMAQLRQNASVSARALEFTILTAVRTSEAIGATWGEIDMQAGIWTIPASRIKAKREHRVPLSPAVLAILERLPRERDNDHLFIGARAGKSLSNMAMLELLRGVWPGTSVHGFRSSFRDWCAERTSFPRELAEVALAHALKDKTEAAYQRADLLQKRRQLMTAWARYCASPARAEGKVIEIGARR